MHWPTEILTFTLTIDHDVGLNEGFSWGRPMYSFRLLRTDGELKDRAGSAVPSIVKGTVLDKQEVSRDARLNLVLS